jgi:hypothetical protein
MSIYPSPKQHNGSLNTIFNNTDYIIINSGGGGGLTIAQTDARYLKNSGLVVSSASITTFDGKVDVKNINVSTLLDASNINVSGLATMKNITATGKITSGNIDATNISISTLATVKDITATGQLKVKQSTDTLTSDIFRSDQLYSFSNGMVYSIISDATTVNSVSFINIPTTTNQSYIFTFILQPSTASNPYYIKPSSNTVVVNGVSVPLYGLQSVVLPSSYTYLVQQISIIYDVYSGNNFFALTSVSAY